MQSTIHDSELCRLHDALSALLENPYTDILPLRDAAADLCAYLANRIQPEPLSERSDTADQLTVFTVFCQEASGRGTIHIDSLDAPDIEAAILAAKQCCIDDWGTQYTLDDIHCLGVAAGDIDILHWQDLDAS